jgi:hypothetical protein
MVTFPGHIIAGETLALCVADSAYTGVTAYAVGPARQEIALALEDGEWAATRDTADWTPGLYSFEVWAVSSPALRELIERGQFTVLPSLISSSVATIDARSDAQKMVEMIQAMIAGNATQGVRRYRINNRELERYSLAELLQLLSYWKRQAEIERRRAAGLPVLGPKIRVHI